MNLSDFKKVAPAVKFYYTDAGHVTCDETWYKKITQLYLISEWKNIVEYIPPDELMDYIKEPNLDQPLLFNKDGSFVRTPILFLKIQQRMKNKTAVVKESFFSMGTFIALFILIASLLYTIFRKKEKEGLIQRLIAQVIGGIDR